MAKRSCVTALLLLLCAGGLSCKPAPPRPPQFVVLIVDTSASVAPLQDSILGYAKAALNEYAAKGKMKVTVINLDEAPSVEFQREGVLYEEDVDDIVAHVKAIDYDAKGTDIIGAFELALRYYGYEKTPPTVVKILCFTDGFAEGPKGTDFRDWGDHDWSRLGATKASVAVYFVDPRNRDKVEGALGPSAGQYVVKNANDALDELQRGEPYLP